MGLAAAHYACQAGLDVTVVESDDRPGGMAAHFDFGGLSLERFYHFCCRSDIDTLGLLKELDIEQSMQWVSTKMGYFVDGKLYQFGDPLSLLKFTPLSLIEKIRYGLMVFTSTRRTNWSKLDKITARTWITRWCGQRAYEKLWKPLLHLKFYEFTDDISAAWMWQRINRLGRSRRSLFSEELGYLEGGTQTLVDKLTESILNKGGVIRYKAPVKHIVANGQQVTGVETNDGERIRADLVFSTAPLPYVSSMVARDMPQLQSGYQAMNNVGVICVIHKLARPVSNYFWVNVSDDSMKIPGFVEFSNLRPMDKSIVYVPYYMPSSNPKFKWSDEALLEESFGYLMRINPDLSPEDRLDSHVARLRHAQPVCHTEFKKSIPELKTPVAGLWIADTSYYYPEDRGVSESIRFARQTIDTLANSPA